MRRREFIAGTMLGAVGLPIIAHAQPASKARRIGVIVTRAADDSDTHAVWLSAFQRELMRLGWQHDTTVRLSIEALSLDPDTARARVQALVSEAPDVIVAVTTNALKHARAQTSSIPIVLLIVSDPLSQGIVDNLARPSGNATGFTNLEFSLLGKWLGMLREIAPAATRIGLMIGRNNASSAGWYRTFDELAPKAGCVPIPLPVASETDIASAMERLAREPGAGLIVPGDSLVERPRVRQRIVALARDHKVPTIYTTREFVADGGLVAYGIDQAEQFRLAAGYVDRILNGAKPSDLPVQQPTRFKLALNLGTAKALGVTIPMTIQATADEVIE